MLTKDDYMWLKISAAGEMKTAIKRFLSDFEEGKDTKKRIKELRKSLEKYLNT